jgi:site-specific recombinase XerD
MTDFDKLLDEFLDYITASGKKVRANCTFGLSLFKSYIDDSGIDFLKVKVKHAQDFQSYLMSQLDNEGQIKYSKNTVIGAVSGANYFYSFLKEKNLVYSNPFLIVKKIKKKKGIPQDLLNEEDMNKLLTYMSNFWKGKNVFEKRQLYRAYLVVELLYSTGMTVTELKTIRLSNLDLEKNIVTVSGVYHENRDCILNDYMAKLLKIYIEKVRPFYFVGSNYKAGQNDLTLLFGCSTELPRTVNRIVKKACEKLGVVQVLLKNIRFVVGYHLVRGGCDIRYVQEIIGHKSLDTTSLFLKVEKEGLKNVLDKYHPRTHGRAMKRSGMTSPRYFRKKA